MLINVLVGLLILALIVYCAVLILNMLPLPPQIKQIASVIVGVILLIVLLSYLGMVPGWGGPVMVAPR